MAKITIERLDDPSMTRTVSSESFRRWPRFKDASGNVSPDIKTGGKYQWREVPKDSVPAPKVKKGEIIAPPEVQRLVKKDPNA